MAHETVYNTLHIFCKVPHFAEYRTIERNENHHQNHSFIQRQAAGNAQLCTPSCDQQGTVQAPGPSLRLLSPTPRCGGIQSNPPLLPLASARKRETQHPGGVSSTYVNFSAVESILINDPANSPKRQAVRQRASLEAASTMVGGEWPGYLKVGLLFRCGPDPSPHPGLQLGVR